MAFAIFHYFWSKFNIITVTIYIWYYIMTQIQISNLYICAIKPISRLSIVQELLENIRQCPVSVVCRRFFFFDRQLPSFETGGWQENSWRTWKRTLLGEANFRTNFWKPQSSLALCNNFSGKIVTQAKNTFSFPAIFHNTYSPWDDSTRIN